MIWRNRPFGSGNQSQQARLLDRLDAALDVELLIDPRDMGLHRIGRDAERRAISLLDWPEASRARISHSRGERPSERIAASLRWNGRRRPRRQLAPGPQAERDEADSEQGNVDFGRDRLRRMAKFQPFEQGRADRERQRIEE